MTIETKPMSITQAEQGSGRIRENQGTSRREQRKHVALLFVSIVAIYILLAWIHYIMYPFYENQHSIYLADGWLHGHLYLNNVPPDTGDYTLHNGHCMWPFHLYLPCFCCRSWQSFTSHTRPSSALS